MQTTVFRTLEGISHSVEQENRNCQSRAALLLGLQALTNHQWWVTRDELVSILSRRLLVYRPVNVSCSRRRKRGRTKSCD